MIINTNISSLTAQEASKNTNNTLSSSLEKLSSGLKINKASDDASGLAIADKLRTQQTSINQGVSNGNSAVSLLQIADKSMSEQSNILDTVKAKLIQANTDTTSADGREAIRKDISKLLTQLDNIAQQTNYNGTSLLQASRSDNSASAGLSFQVGESKSDLITNTAVQSNTEGLAGQEKLVSAATTADLTLTTGEAQLIKFGDATNEVSVTGGTGNNTTLAVSGKIGTITATTDIIISNVSASDKVKLDAMASASLTDNLINNNDGTYLIDQSVAATLSFADFEVNSMTLTSSAADAIQFTGNAANDRMSVKNIGNANAVIADTGTLAKVGLSLDSLKILGVNELTTELTDLYQGVVDDSITKLNGYRGDIGSTQNQVESAVRNLMTQSTNVAAAESIIRDVDYAEESANFNKQNIISQAGSYAISQANTVQQNVLKLLQ